VDAGGQGDQSDRRAQGGAPRKSDWIDAQSGSHDVSPWCIAFSETCAIARNRLIQRHAGCEPRNNFREIGQKRFNAETVGTKYL
jgi:hypothetical protein